VKYIENGVGRVVKGKMGIWAAQLAFAPYIIEDLERLSPLQGKTMRDLKMAHYSVHNVEITNHPYRDGYDTWTRSLDYTRKDFHDLILGRWV